MIAFSWKLLTLTQLIIIMLYPGINKSIGFAQSFGLKCNFKSMAVIFIPNSMALLKEVSWESQNISENGPLEKS